MPRSVKCGFNSVNGVDGSHLLTLNGPTLIVDIGFDSNHTPTTTTPPQTAVQGLSALVDTGATISCIDNLLAAAINLPVVDRQTVAGSNGSHITNIYQAQVYIPQLKSTIMGTFAGVDLIAGQQQHQILIGRTFLRYFTMVYEGTTGTVTISN